MMINQWTKRVKDKYEALRKECIRRNTPLAGLHQTETLEILSKFPRTSSQIPNFGRDGEKFYGILVYLDGKSYTIQNKNKKIKGEDVSLVLIVFYRKNNDLNIVFDFYHILLDGDLGTLKI